MSEASFGSVIGHVGQPPKTHTSSKGDFVKFTVAEVTGYNKETKEDIITWHDILVYNEGLQSLVRTTLKKGSRVACVGKKFETEYEGRKRQNMNANRIGVVDFLRPTKQDKPSPSEGSELGW